MTAGRSTARIAVRNTVWVTLFSYASQAVGFGAMLVLARLLGPEVFGVFALGNFWASMLNLRSKSGLRYSVIRQPVTTGELLGTAYTLDMVLAVITIALSAGALFALPMFNYAFEVGVVALVMAGLEALFILFVGAKSYELEREMQLSRVGLVGIGASLVSYAVAIILAYAGFGIWSLLAMNIITSVVTIAGVLWVYHKRIPSGARQERKFSQQTAKALLNQGLPAGVADLCTGTIVSQYDNFLVGTFIGPTTLGFYDRAFRTAQWTNILFSGSLQRVSLVTFPKLQHDMPRLTHAVRLYMWVLMILCVPVVLAVVVSAPDLILTLYGPQWAESAFFLRFMAAYALVTPFSGLASIVSYSLGNTRLMLTLAIAQAIAIVALGTPLTLWLGTIGIVVAVGLTNAIGFGISYRFIFGHLPLSARAVFGPALGAIGVALIATYLLFSIPGWSTLPPFVRLILSAGVSSGTYMAVLFVLRPGEMIERVRYLLAAFRHREQGPAADWGESE